MEPQAASGLVGIRTHELIDLDAVELGREATCHSEMQVTHGVGVDISGIGERASAEHEFHRAADVASPRVESAPSDGILQRVHLTAGCRWSDGGASALVEADILGRSAGGHDLHQEA